MLVMNWNNLSLSQTFNDVPKWLDILFGTWTQVKATDTEQYVPVVLAIMLHKVVLPFEYVNETPKCGHSNDQKMKSVGQHFHVALFDFGLQYKF